MFAHLVIGSNFGDEGKGRVTDYLASVLKNPVVVRFNGGAQAGHTVVRDGIRHVFHHFGSGTLAGAPTYLDSGFIINPFLYCDELKELESKIPDFKPQVSASNCCMVTTPWDMVYNQALEDSRGMHRHGSCGVGINTTTNRHEHVGLSLGFLFWNHAKQNHKIIDKVIDYYQNKARAENVTLDDTVFLSPDMRADFFLKVGAMKTGIDLVPSIDAYKRGNNYIFEGAQGLLLDQDHEWFPHVTRSHTGSTNFLILNRLGLSFMNFNTYYVTRSYLTRHGAGPLPGEDSSLYYEDKTNVPHPYQGTLRYAPLNVDLLVESLLKDRLRQANEGLESNTNLVTTCLDQVEDEFEIVRFGYKHKVTRNGLFNILENAGVVDNLWGSTSDHGPLLKITKN